MKLPVFLFLLLAGFSLPVTAISTPNAHSGHVEWKHAMRHGQSLDLSSKIMRARIFFTHIAWNANSTQGNGWAPPAVLLERGTGNLLELVTAYYFTLRGMGVSAQDLRIFFGQIRTLDDPVPHLLLAVRAPNRSVFFVDPIKDIPMSAEPPHEFRPSMALNEFGSWWTPALTDLSVWNTPGSHLVRVEGWPEVRDQTLALLGLAPRPDPFVAALEADPPAAGPKKKVRTKSKAAKKATHKQSNKKKGGKGPAVSEPKKKGASSAIPQAK